MPAITVTICGTASAEDSEFAINAFAPVPWSEIEWRPFLDGIDIYVNSETDDAKAMAKMLNP